MATKKATKSAATKSLSAAKKAAKAPAKSTAKKSATTEPAKAVAKSQPTHNEIAQRAEQFWNERGRPHGSAHEDWHRAEQELKG